MSYPVIEKQGYYQCPISGKQYPYKAGDKADRRRALSECDAGTAKVMQGREVNARAIADLAKVKPTTNGVMHQKGPSSANPWQDMLNSGRPYSPGLRAELETKARAWNEKEEAERKLAAIKESESYKLSLQHARSVVASCRSGAIPDREGREQLLLELETTGNWEIYRNKAHAADQIWYAELDRQSAEKRQAAEALETEAQQIEKQKQA